MNKSLICVADMNLILDQNEYLNLAIEANEPLTLKIVAKKRIQSTLLIDVKKAGGQIDLEIDVEAGSKLTVLFWNTAVQYTVHETVRIYRDATYKVAYSELEQGMLERRAEYRLEESGASVNIVSAAIANRMKKQELTCAHLAGHTSSLIQTYGIVLKDGDYSVKATGSIRKGAKESKTHQISRVLTFSSQQKANVMPLLLIDENDVEASHATSIGQLDENQLYYLQSRGLTQNQALQLMALGYLMPLADIIEDPSLKTRLQETITKKVQETCLI